MLTSLKHPKKGVRPRRYGIVPEVPFNFELFREFALPNVQSTGRQMHGRMRKDAGIKVTTLRLRS